MGLFNQADPDHPIYGGGSFIQGVPQQETTPPAQLGADEIKDELAEGREADVDEQEYASLLLNHWLPTIAPTLKEPLTARDFNSLPLDALGCEELLNVSTDFAGVALYGLSLKNGYRIYIEIPGGDQFCHEQPLLHAGFAVTGKRESNKRDREWIQNLIKADSGNLFSLVESCFLSDDWLEYENAPAASGKYAKLFEAAHKKFFK